MLDSYKLLEAMNGIDEEQVEATRRFLETKEEAHTMPKAKVWRTLLIAAVITALMSVTAYAISQFQIHGRPAETDEKMTLVTGNALEGRYVFTFDGPEECRAIHFKPTWAPREDYWFWWPDDDKGWISHEIQSRESWNEEYSIYFIDCVIEAFYAPQFIHDGHLFLTEYLPGEITEESWGELTALKFTGTGLHQIDGKDTYGNYVLLFHPDQGWIISVCGHDSMENIEQIARGLEVEQTDEVIRAADYEGYNVFWDIHVG